ncbi:MAG: hypothetical protein ACAH95_02695 [Fimbriimonas sp.]
MATTTQRGFRLPHDVADLLQQKPNATEYVIEAVREKAQREREAQIAEGLACLAWDDEANDISDLKDAQARALTLGD